MNKTIDIREKLKSFLFTAKRSTFADLDKRPIFNRGRKEYKYENNEWCYQDCYFGSLKDIGHEIVWYNNSPLWGMNYYGGITKEYSINDADIIFNFLKKALLELPEDFPIRGPSIFTYSSYLYMNIWNGMIDEFIGEEYIFFKKQNIYKKV